MSVPTSYRRGASLPSSNPFERLRNLLDGIEPKLSPIAMTIGEPQHAMPDFIADVLNTNLADFKRYPPINGIPEFREAVGAWLEKRYDLGGMIDVEKGILPLNGSREGLSFGAISARDQLKKDVDVPAVILPNPFYQTYAAAAHIADAEAVLLDAKPGNNFLPDLDSVEPALLDRTIAFYVASPTNPEGHVAPISYLQKLIGLARKHNFIIFADECYSEIYRAAPPPGIFEAAKAMSNGSDKPFDKIVVLNSLSKRSNLAGLRCGFAAGDPEFLSNWARFRGLAAPQVPIPNQYVAAAAYRDEDHVIENRRLYNEKFDLAEKLLAPSFPEGVTPDAGFMIWLDVSRWGDSVTVAKKLFEDTGIRTIPGEYLAIEHSDGTNPGRNFLRLSLCAPLDTIETAFQRMAKWFGETA